MITSEIKNFLNLQKLGYVATVSSDGKPNISSKGPLYYMGISEQEIKSKWKKYFANL